jgi:hypothetical protein
MFSVFLRRLHQASSRVADRFINSHRGNTVSAFQRRLANLAQEREINNPDGWPSSGQLAVVWVSTCGFGRWNGRHRQKSCPSL